jgi:outer membrane immunogenic protein
MGNTMKKLLLGSSILLGMAATAAAADLSVYSKAPPPAWSWSGFYFGVQGGTGWGTSEDLATGFCPAGPGGGLCATPILFSPATGILRSSYTLNGLHGGGTAGFNWQTGPIVLGVEGDLSGANIEGTGDCSESLGRTFNQGGFFTAGGCHTKLTWFGTVTGRLGVTVDHALLYVKAGGAWGHFDQDAAMSLFIANGPGGGPSSAAVLGTNRSGYTVGTGIEYALWSSNWSAKVEYDFMDFGTKNLTFPFVGNLFGAGNTANLFVDDRERVHVVRVGLNYRFWSGGPLFSKY